MGQRMRRVMVVAGLSTALLGGFADTARADPARPTNYRSEVTSLSPPTPAVEARVVGGDAFLEIRVDLGTEVTVLGYGQEPYVHVDATGSVWVNTRSPAHYLNDDRYAQTAIPAEASVEAEPAWEQVALGGEYAWHDHRIHWMSPQPPPGIQPATESEIMQWAVPLEVDGRRVDVTGRLWWIPGHSPVPWIVMTSLAAGALIGLHRAVAWGVPAVVMLGGTAALIVGTAETLAAPLGAGGEVLSLGPPAVALALGMLTLLHPRAPTLPLVGGLLVGVWALLRVATLWMPELPTGLPPVLERLGVAVALAAALTAAFSVVRTVITPPPPAVAALAVVATVALGGGSAALAHTEPDLIAVPAGATATITFQPTHGCEDSPTVEVVIRAPLEGATAGEVAGWDATAEPDAAGNTILTWAGGTLASEATGAFPVTFVAPDLAGELLLFPAIQVCASGEELAWLSGDPASDYPAPRILVLPAGFEPAATLEEVPPDAPDRQLLLEGIAPATTSPTTTTTAAAAATDVAADADHPAGGGIPWGWIVGVAALLAAVIAARRVTIER